jgi:CHASE3 domain sensor protein
VQQEGGLAEHAIVGLVLTGLLVIVVVAMVLIGFAAYSGVKTVRHDTRNVKLTVARSTNLIAVRAASMAAAEEGSGGLDSKRQSRLSLNVVGTDSVAMTTTSVSVDVHPTGEESTTL